MVSSDRCASGVLLKYRMLEQPRVIRNNDGFNIDYPNCYAASRQRETVHCFECFDGERA